MILLLAGCSSFQATPPPAKIITETEYITPPKPIVPQVDPLTLRNVEFIIITPENQEEVFADLSKDKALIALTAEGYEKLALNISDIRALIQQQKTIIAVYEKQWEESLKESPKPEENMQNTEQ
jgi:hypothetical protein